jgi:hypothetical protein
MEREDLRDVETKIPVESEIVAWSEYVNAIIL